MQKYLKNKIKSRLCFGTLSISPWQGNFPLNKGVQLLKSAVENSVNFFDSAEIYQTYAYLRALIKFYPDVIITTKTFAYTKEQAKNSVEKALRELDRDYIDIFLLHEQESILTIKGHWEAFEELLKYKEKGIIKAVGISTHTTAGVKGATETKEIDIIHPLYNYKGWGIKDGTVEEMLFAIKNAYKAGKELYAMKALAGGHLIKDNINALKHVFNIKEFSAVAVGIQSYEELMCNLALAKGLEPEEQFLNSCLKQPRFLLIEDWCEGCGNCVEMCQQKALSINDATQKVQVDKNKCILCGYCSSVCKEFCIKVI